jgi:F-type H+-transporting ATPase subunit gamma
MPGAKERTLRRRINSVQSTKKITRAMELIAATRVVKAQQRANEAKPYSRMITSVIENLAAGGADVDHPLLREVPHPTSVGVIAITSDRGLAGAYNASVIRAAERQIDAARATGADYQLIQIGKKGRDYFRFRGFRIAGYYEGISDSPSYDAARQVADQVMGMFVSGEIQRVELVYTEFVSLGTQRVSIRRYLPLLSTSAVATQGGGDAEALSGFELEPSAERVLSSLLPRYCEARLYGAMLESAASEHASRQRAMKAATDNAEDLIVRLSREMNQARQDAITTEIMEIVGGAEALRASAPDEEAELAKLLAGITPST